MNKMKIIITYFYTISAVGIFIPQNINSETNVDGNVENIFEWDGKKYIDFLKEEEIRLAGKHYTRLPATLFQNSKDTKIIDLSNNKLIKIDEIFFTPCTKLRYLNMSDNSLFVLEENVFQKNQLMEQLDISRNQLTSIPSAIFQSLKMLKDLRICKNKIKYLDDNLFENLENLKFIDLSENNIIELPENLFKNCKNLEILMLGNNYLKSIPRFMFWNIKKLRILNVSENRLTIIYPETFSSLWYLEKLDFSSNHLSMEEYSYSPFALSRNLTHLNLSKNSVPKLFQDWRMLLNLKELDLSYNQLKYLNAEDFIFISSNATINFTKNPLEIINLDKIEDRVDFVKPGPIQLFYTKKEKKYNNNTFILENIEIKCDCFSSSFAKYLQSKMNEKVYRVLKISSYHGIRCNSPDKIKNVSLKVVDTEELKCLLKEVFAEEAAKCPEKCQCYYRSDNDSLIINCRNVSMNNFPTEIPVVEGLKTILLFDQNNINCTKGLSELSKQGKITEISLSSNKLEEFEDVQLPETLEVLKIDRNRIWTISPKAIAYLRTSNLKLISIWGNPWKCSCDAVHLQAFIRYHKHSLVIPEKESITCEGDQKPLLEVDLCPTSSSKIFTGVLVFAFIALLLLIIWTKCKERITRWMFSHKICRGLISEDVIDKKKSYDAFISFSSQDKAFVDRILRPALEENQKVFKLCVYYRDFQPGKKILDHIVASMEDSRRIIAILTPAFFESAWTHTEIQMAHLNSLKENNPRLLLVYLKDFPKEDLDEELKKIVTDYIHLEADDPLFIDRLIRSLPNPIVKPNKKSYEKAKKMYSNNIEMQNRQEQTPLTKTDVYIHAKEDENIAEQEINSESGDSVRELT